MVVKPTVRSGILVQFTCAVHRRNENLRKEFVIKTMFVGED
jgi:hypothetical protein